VKKADRKTNKKSRKKPNWRALISRKRSKSWSKKMLAGKKKFASKPTALRKVRITKELSQMDAARLAGMSFTSFGDVERGTRKIRQTQAARISKALKVPLKRLFKLKGEKLYARAGA
jgi:DNA-binding XRE family transcriptional regulator